MTPPGIALPMACAAVAIGTVIGWIAAAGLATVPARRGWPARSRATFLAQVRLLPLAVPAILVAAQSLAFMRFEQSRTESAGPLLLVLAGIGLALVGDAAWRGTSCRRATAALIANWRRTAMRFPQKPFANWSGRAWLFSPAFPVVAVVGAFRPQLFVARQVLLRCTREEMAAILAHERAHVRSRDTLVRLLFTMTPGARLFRRVALPLERAWQTAVEEAADQFAGHAAGHLELASALTKVARLSPAPSSPAAVSALIGESELDQRVLRLIEASGPPRRTRVEWVPAVVLVLAAVAMQTSPLAAGLHELFERLVRTN